MSQGTQCWIILPHPKNLNSVPKLFVTVFLAHRIGPLSPKVFKCGGFQCFWHFLGPYCWSFWLESEHGLGMGMKSVFSQMPHLTGWPASCRSFQETSLLEFKSNVALRSLDLHRVLQSGASCSWFWSVSSLSQSVIIYSSKQTVRRNRGIRLSLCLVLWISSHIFYFWLRLKLIKDRMSCLITEALLEDQPSRKYRLGAVLCSCGLRACISS